MTRLALPFVAAVVALSCAAVLAQSDKPQRKYKTARQLNNAVVALETEVAALRQRLESVETRLAAAGVPKQAAAARGTRSQPLIKGPLEVTWQSAADSRFRNRVCVSFKVKNISGGAVKTWPQVLFFDSKGDQLYKAHFRSASQGYGAGNKIQPVDLEPGGFQIFSLQQGPGSIDLPQDLYRLVQSFDVVLSSSKP